MDKSFAEALSDLIEKHREDGDWLDEIITALEDAQAELEVERDN